MDFQNWRRCNRRRYGDLANLDRKLFEGILPMSLMSNAESARMASCIDAVVYEVSQEVRSAMRKHGPMKSSHEGYAVILEELDELWQEVKHGTKENAYKEAVQVAAMAIRFIVDLRK